MSSEEFTMSFIEDYKARNFLWDVKNKDYTNTTKRNAVYAIFADKYNMTVKDVRNKIRSLRSYFFREHNKVLRKNGYSGDDDIKYVPTWFAYDAMKFILDSPKSKKDNITFKCGRKWELDIEIPEEYYKSSEDSKGREKPKIREKLKSKEINGSSYFQSASPFEAEHSFVHSTSTSLPNKKRKARCDEYDQSEEEAPHLSTVKDEFDIFGEMVAIQIRKLNQYNQALAKNRIQNYLFELEMEELNSVSLSQNNYTIHYIKSSSSPPPQSPTASDCAQSPSSQNRNNDNQELE